MADQEVLVLWRIGKEQQIGGGNPQIYRHVMTIVALNQNWTLNVTSLKPTPQSLVLKGSSSRNMKVVGNFELLDKYSVRDSLVTTKKFVKIFEANKGQLLLPINRRPNDNIYSFCFRPLEIHGYINISEIDSASAKDNPNDENLQSKSKEQLSNDICGLLKGESCVFSDVKLKCEDVIFPAHKNILSARSPVFASMFRNKMKESQDGIVCVKDIDPTIFGTMLNYVYSGETGELKNFATAEQLLFAADKYQLDGLKEICIDYLKSHLSLDNALYTLVLGDVYDRHLKSDVLLFILNTGVYSKLKEQEEWKFFVCEKPKLSTEVLTFIANHLCDNAK